MAEHIIQNALPPGYNDQGQKDFSDYTFACTKRFIEESANLALNSASSIHNKGKQYFISHKTELINEIQYNLIHETYIFSKLHTYIIHEPKERKIDIPPFYPDRIYQHIAMDMFKDTFIKSFIKQTYSSIKGRGLHACINKVKEIRDKYPDYYYISIDIKKYFESIDLDILIQNLHSLQLDDKLLTMLVKSLRQHPKGLAIGCYTSQYLANFYLNDFDHVCMWMCNGLYVRYMDNCTMWVKTKEEAHRLLNFLRWYLQISRKLEIKNDWRIAKISTYPLRFCGFVIYPDHVRIRKNIKQNAQRAARKLDKKGVPDDIWKQKMASYYGWFKACNGAHLWRTIKNGRKIYMKQELKKFSDISTSIGEFGLDKEQRVSITDIIGKPIVFEDAHISTFKFVENGQEIERERLCVKFKMADQGDGLEQYFVSGSTSLRDRTLKHLQNMPFIGTITEVPSKNKRGTFYIIT